MLRRKGPGMYVCVVVEEEGAWGGWVGGGGGGGGGGGVGGGVRQTDRHTHTTPRHAKPRPASHAPTKRSVS